MGLFFFIYAALVGFFGFAALYHLILWWFSRRETLLAVFSADCAIRAVFSGVLLAVAAAETIEDAQVALRTRIAVGMLMMITWVWSLSLVSGVRARRFVIPISILFGCLFVVQTFIYPLNAPVTSVEHFTLPWGEKIANPKLGPPGWWFAPVYAMVLCIEFFGLYCAATLWKKDRLAGGLIMVAIFGVLFIHVVEILKGYGILILPFMGVIPFILWVSVIALLIARNHGQTRKQLAASQQQFRGIFNQTFQLIGLLKTDGTLIEANRTALDFAGITEESVLGKPFWQTPWWAHSQELQVRIREAVGLAASGTAVRFEVTHPQPGGRLAFLDFSLKPVRDERGEITLLIPEGRDITERKLAEESLRANARRLALAYRATSDAIWEWNYITGDTYYSPRWYEMLGLNPDLPMTFETWKSLCHPDDFQPTMDIIRAAVEAPPGAGYSAEFRMRHANGNWLWILGRGNVVERDAQGRPKKLAGTNTDIHQRKEAEETIRQILEGIAPTTGRDFFQALANHLSRVCQVKYAFIGALDLSDSKTVRSLAASRQGTSIENFSYSLQDTPCETVVGRELCHYVTGVQQNFPQDTMLVEMGIDSYLGIPLWSSTGQALGLIVLLHDQPMAYAQRAETLLRVIASRAAAELERELAEMARRETEQVLREQETFLRLAQQAAQVGSWEWNIPTNRFNWSDELARMHGIERSEFDGEFTTVLSFCHPEDSHRLREAMAASLTREDMRAFECRIRRRDGAVRDLWFLGRLQNDEHGQPIKVLGVAIDITDRKQAEEDRRALESQLAQSQKMEAIGQLAAGVAHDFNNMLTVINGYTELMRSTASEHDDESIAMLDGILDAGGRAAALTRQLLTFTRRQVVEPRVVDLNTVVIETEQMLRRLIGEDIALTTSLDRHLPRVKADPGQLGQVIINLAVNARDAMPTGGCITIETSSVELSDALTTQHPGAARGRHVVLSVTDTGLGMTPEVRSRIFEPFFTTKGAGKGTGLGLSTVRTIAEESRGFLVVHSELGRGSTFQLYLPALPGSVSPERDDPAKQDPPQGQETILLVEDEDAVRTLTSCILQQFGYTVLEATGGAEAIPLLEKHSGSIDLLITDVVMPEMGGRKLVEHLTYICPGLKVLYLSGYTDDAVVRHGVLEADVAFLQKPFTMDALAHKVRQTLDAGSRV